MSEKATFTPIIKNNKNIIFPNNKKILSKPKNEAKTNINNINNKRKITLRKFDISCNKKCIVDTLIKKSISKNKKKNKNKNKSFNNMGTHLKNNKKNNEKNNNKQIIPILRINNTNGDIIKINIKDRTNFYKNGNTHNCRMRGGSRHEKMNKNDTLCLKITNIRHKNNNMYNKNENLNKKLIDYCRKEEVNKLKIFNNINRNNVFREYSETNRIKNRNIFKKSYSNFNKYNEKELFKRKKNLMDYFNNNDNDSCIHNNYTHLISIEFPAINSYFNKLKNEKKK